MDKDVGEVRVLYAPKPKVSKPEPRKRKAAAAPDVAPKPKDQRRNHHAQSHLLKDANGQFPCGRGCGRTFAHAPAAASHTKACKHGAPVQAADCPVKPKPRKRKAAVAPAPATPGLVASAFGATGAAVPPPPPPTFLYATPDGFWNVYGDAWGRRWYHPRY